MPPHLHCHDFTPASQRLLLVLPGAVSAARMAPTPLEQATLPNLRGLAQTGAVAALSAVDGAIPATEANAAATLLGVRLATPLDPGAVMMESLGKLLASGEQCTIIEVLCSGGAPAPALEVQRAAAAVRSQVRGSRVVAQRGSHQLLVVANRTLAVPQLEGLQLRPLKTGVLPPKLLGSGTVAIAVEGSALLGAAGLLGAATTHLSPTDLGQTALLDELRRCAMQALSGGAQTVVVESTAARSARTAVAGGRTRETAARSALELVDRTLVGPLAAAAGWLNARFAVTSDLPRRGDGTPTHGLVPVVLAPGRGATASRPRRTPLAPRGTTPPPAYSERALPNLPEVQLPFALTAEPPHGAVSAARAPAPAALVTAG